MGILSIQSAVVYGHVGNRAAVFLLERLGFEVWPLDTVSFSNHPAYPTVRGRVVPAAEVRALLEGVEERGALARCDAVLSGYLGEPDTAAVVLEAVARVKAARPDALFCCDPVMGDVEKGVYVAPALPALFRERLLPAADIVTPNAVELALLTGLSAGTEAEALAAAEAARRRGPGVVVVTGLPDAAGKTLSSIAVAEGGAWVTRVARRDRPAHGAGDAFTAVFLAAYLRGGDVPRALGRATAALEAIFDASEAAGSSELALVAAADRIAAAAAAPVERLL
ncbi:MAG: pyridoxal kinase PdxY [Candidatus Rokuibacteriota bacterium]